MKPTLNLRKGCPFCGNTDLIYNYDPLQYHMDILCKNCNCYFTFRDKPPIYTEMIWNKRTDEEKSAAESIEPKVEAILSELKNIKSYVAELAGYSIKE